MSTIRFEGVHKSFGNEVAVNNLDLEVQEGELVSILGPSGCGKTTALRMLAGFIEPTKGQILVDGKSVLGTPANKRNFGMVFQAYSLFPNMTVEQNIKFPLEVRKSSSAWMSQRIEYLLELTNMQSHKAKYPHQLSGGQQQRVALARALAAEPRVLLLDEPLSALDAAVREQLRLEIRSLQQSSGVTTIFVTHDQQEALSISDRVAVMQNGEMVQIAEPESLYRDPANEFVANFVGHTNRIPLEANGEHLVWRNLNFQSNSVKQNATAFIRPEEFEISEDNSSTLKVIDKSFYGALTRYTLADAEIKLIVDVAEMRESEAVDIGAFVAVQSKRKYPLIVSK